ncbi:MAG: PIN domain-containing protein [Acetobacteraceae bacterium]|nr:PIN domain-containing protein [Acetobacteraceae bacterium]
MTFVDTNVLVYSTAETAPFHQQARAAAARELATGQLAISRQVLREYLATVTRPQTWSRALTLTEAFEDAQAFARRFVLLEDGPAVWDKVAALGRTVVFAGKQVHDANLVATMLAYGVAPLLTFNVADFQRFSPVVETVAP